MAISQGLTTLPVTISNGTALSSGVPFGAKMLVGIAMSAGWDAAVLSFQVSYDGGTTYQEMVTSAGTAIGYTVAANQFIAVDPTLWRGVNMVKVRSGTSGTPVNQTADRILNLITGYYS